MVHMIWRLKTETSTITFREAKKTPVKKPEFAKDLQESQNLSVW